jgi:hypothetical protein
MYIARVPNRSSPPAYLLRGSYREAGKVKNRTLANLSHLPIDQIEQIRRELSQAGTEQASVGAGEEESDAEAEIGEAVAVALGLADDQPMQAETAQLVRHLARGDVAGMSAQQRSEVLPQVTIGEPPGQQTKAEQR